MPLQLGSVEISMVSGGRLWIDGGNMFGVVPRAMWSRKAEPDEQNRILLETWCPLVRSAQHLVLIDSGYGDKAPEKTRQNFSMESGHPLLRNLAAIGVHPDEITHVILTHLHFDHAGGCTQLDAAGKALPVFRNARHVVQQAEWDDATARKPELAGAYFEQDFLPLRESGVLDLVESDTRVVPEISVELTGGHTRGQQIVHLGSEPSHAVFLADLCPFTAHMPTMWSMAYDQFPLEQRRAKPRVLGRAADENAIVLFDHDPKVKAARIVRDAKREFAVSQIVIV